MFLHWKRNRTMNNTKLKKAMILGTIALIWTIPSVNLFGVIAVIVSWIAYSNSKKNMAYVSTGMYIAATVISILFAIVLLFAGGMFSFVGEAAGVSHNAMTTLLTGMAAFSLVGDGLYIAAAVSSYKGGKAAEKSDSQNNGFFE
jgi:dolichyl-phosphate-mannose--protein O-mannosyl transferase